ncbi:tetratricopeptide repeat protein [Hyalangium sp.]|uniref:tetratricopeptide repeat protein n=1 Tax=Hyalangium sp. TaxID=2028555 RepID=UPI002D758549|nr:tetratricopeptide repeat protein [Hyalangium sp.]HYI00464.1 tetratricopeptide repeat protein [Hyalangium sp.]
MLERLPIFRRLLAVVPLCALAACAHDSASQADMAALRAELRAMREQQARLGERLERIERSSAVIRARPSQAPAASSPQAPAKTPASQAAPSSSASHVEVPDLTVVKLKPKAEPAPSLPTKVAVVEPEAEQVELFVSSSPEPSEPVSAPSPVNTAVLDAEFEQAVAALRTGNVEPGVVKLQSFAEQNPRHPRADNALYFAGLGMVGLNDHAGAALVFERLIETYPAGDAVLDGMLRLAECRLKLNQREDARALYTRVITQFPGTAAATQAEQRLASLPH